MIDLQKVKDLAMDIDVDLKMTDVDTGAYIDAAKEKTALLIAELEKQVDVEPWDIARKIHDDVKSSECFNPFNSAVMIQQYAEAYHAKRCGECESDGRKSPCDFCDCDSCPDCPVFNQGES